MNAEKILLQFADLKDLPVRFDALLFLNTFSENIDPVKSVSLLCIALFLKLPCFLRSVRKSVRGELKYG